MSGGHRSRWEERDRNLRGDPLDRHVRWRVGNLAGEIEAWRHRLERQETVRAEGWHQGEPGA